MKITLAASEQGGRLAQWDACQWVQSLRIALCALSICLELWVKKYYFVNSHLDFVMFNSLKTLFFCYVVIHSYSTCYREAFLLHDNAIYRYVCTMYHIVSQVVFNNVYTYSRTMPCFIIPIHSIFRAYYVQKANFNIKISSNDSIRTLSFL